MENKIITKKKNTIIEAPSHATIGSVTSDPNDKREIVLSVHHLKQYFKFSKGDFKYNKAVHDVSFDIHKGEVLGLVGESGCGKTTTGRSIIKLYNITSGSVYFKGIRIAAGTRWNEKEIKFKTKKAKDEISAIRLEEKNEIDHLHTDQMDEVEIKETTAKIHNLADKKVAKIREDLSVLVKKQREEIKLAKNDNKNCNKMHANEKVLEVKKAYEPKFKAFKAEKTNLKQKFDFYKEYEEEIHLAHHDKIMNSMQMIFQDPIASLDPRMTVREIIAEGLKIRGIRNSKVIDHQVNEVLTKVGLLPEHSTRYPHEFSGGQRQRIGIARALIMNPELIIADEPISALDVSIQAQVINLLNELKHELNLTILFIAHDLSVVKYFCDRIAVMYYGNLVEIANSDELFKHPLHPYTKSLLSAIPLPDPYYEKFRKRIEYNPAKDHDYSTEKPVLQEVIPGHYVRCNSIELEKYREIIKSKNEK